MAKMEVGRACVAAQRWEVVDIHAALATSGGGSQARETSDEMGGRFEIICRLQGCKMAHVGRKSRYMGWSGGGIFEVASAQNLSRVLNPLSLTTEWATVRCTLALSRAQGFRVFECDDPGSRRSRSRSQVTARSGPRRDHESRR